MLLELAKPVTFTFCILSLYAVFHTAFLVPATTLRQRIYDSLAMLALAGAIAIISGLIFGEAEHVADRRETKLSATLPVRIFCWGASSMLLLFVISWYLETYCIFYRDVRF